MKKTAAIMLILAISLFVCSCKPALKEPLAGEEQEALQEEPELEIDLSDYPDFFSGTIYIVVGPKAPSIDVLSGIDIALELEKTKAALDNEIDIDNKNAVIVGNPCDNKFTNEFMPYEEECNEYLEDGKAVIKLVKTGPGTHAVIVFGYTPAETRRAAQLLKNYKTSGLEGTEMIV